MNNFFNSKLFRIFSTILSNLGKNSVDGGVGGMGVWKGQDLQVLEIS